MKHLKNCQGPGVEVCSCDWVRSMLSEAMVVDPSTHLLPCRWQYPLTCRGNQGYVEFMAPSLSVDAEGQAPTFLPLSQDRPIDVLFSGCAPLLEVGMVCCAPLTVAHAAAMVMELSSQFVDC